MLTLPSPQRPAEREVPADPPDARIGTIFAPRAFIPWLAPTLGFDVRLNQNTGASLAAEVATAVPFQLWRGAFDPAFLPTVRLSSRGTSALDLCAGLGAGLFDEPWRYHDTWKTLSYTPQLAWRFAGNPGAGLGFRHDLVMKPDVWHVGLSHTVWRHEGQSVHELRLVLGASMLEGLM